MARYIMIQGVDSGAGQSVIAAGICRMLFQEGWRVAPLMLTNRSMNTPFLPDVQEMHHAELIQAEAAGIQAHGVTLPAASALIEPALERLSGTCDWVVMEGVHGPKSMAIAAMTGAAILLVADLAKDGSSDALVRTLHGITDSEREQVTGILLNGYSGPAAAIADLEKVAGKTVRGIVPAIEDLYWDGLDPATSDHSQRKDLRIAVVRLPHLAHFTDGASLQAEPDVSVVYVDRPADLTGADALLLPGSRNIFADLAWLRAQGLADAINAHSRSKGALVGFGGGCDILGVQLSDAAGLYGAPGVFDGLGALPVITELRASSRPTTAEVEGLSGMLGAWCKGDRLAVYAHQTGSAELFPGARPAFRVTARSGNGVDETDGCMERGGWTFGSHFEGLFANDGFRRRFLNALRARRGLVPLESRPLAAVLRERTYNRVAQALRDHVDLHGILP